VGRDPFMGKTPDPRKGLFTKGKKYIREKFNIPPSFWLSPLGLGTKKVFPVVKTCYNPLRGALGPI